jgi:hypothetical protein
MELKGRLGTIPLADVLEFIREKGHTGQLCVSFEFQEQSPLQSLLGEKREERLYVTEGRLVGVVSQWDGAVWARILVRCGVASRYQEQNLARQLNSYRATIEEMLPVLVETSPEDLERCCQFYVDEVSTYLFAANEGDFSFEFCDVPESYPGWKDLELADLIRAGVERAALLDRLWELCPDPWTPLGVAPLAEEEPSPSPLSSRDWGVLRLVNNSRTVAEILSQSPWPVHEVCEGLIHLFEQNQVRTISLPSDEENEEALDALKDSAVSTLGRLRSLFGRDRRKSAETSLDTVGKWCEVCRQVYGQVQGSEELGVLQSSWRTLVACYPAAALLSLSPEGFDALRFSDTCEAWGGKQGDWSEVEQDCEAALVQFLAQVYQVVSFQKGAKKAAEFLNTTLEKVGLDKSLPGSEKLHKMIGDIAA